MAALHAGQSATLVHPKHAVNALTWHRGHSLEERNSSTELVLPQLSARRRWMCSTLAAFIWAQGRGRALSSEVLLQQLYYCILPISDKLPALS